MCDIFETNVFDYSFVLDPTIGEFVMTQKQMKIPGPYVQYSVNESYSPTWDPRVKKFVDDKKVERDNPIPQRYDLKLNNIFSS